MKRVKGVLSVLLAVMLLASCLPMTAWAAPSGTSGKYGGGEGTEKSPYLITSAEDMKTLSETPDDWDKHFKVNRTIDLSPVCGETLNGGTNWTPIGNNKGRPFTGVFDGAHHKITGLYIHAEDGDYQGLFGSIWGGSVKDLRVYGDVTGKDNVGILSGLLAHGSAGNCYSYGSVSGNEEVGGLLGSNYVDAVMEDCHNAATVTGDDVVGGIAGQNFGSLLHCYNTGRVNGSGWFGGAAGINADFGVVSNCYNSGTVNGHNVGFGGGFVGANCDDAVIEYCFNSGDVIAVEGAATYDPGIVGGVAGWNDNIVRNCYNSGNINASYAAGGVIGHLSGRLETCFNTGKVTSTDMFGALISGGIAGDVDASGGTAIHCYYLAGTADGGIRGEDVPGAAEAVGKLKIPSFMKLANSAAAAEDEVVMPSFSELTGFSADIWADSAAVAHPVLKMNAENTYQDEDGTYLISSLEALEWFRDEVNNGNSDISAKLTADIDMATKYHEDGESWEPIGPFDSTFDGDHYKIIGLYINAETGAQGLFNTVNEDGIIQNLGIVDGFITGHDFVGGVAANNSGTVYNCSFAGEVNGSGSAVGGIVGAGRLNNIIESCYNTGTVTGGISFVGGVVGYFWGKENLANCYNTGTVSGLSMVGGIVGASNTATTENCYNTGTVTGTKWVAGIAGDISPTGGASIVRSCYNIGTVIGEESVGGIATRSTEKSIVTNCYYLENTADGGIDGEDEIGHAEPITAEELADINTFIDWNFSTVWGMSTNENDMRPVLRAIPEHEYDETLVPETPEAPEQDTDGAYLIPDLDTLEWFRDQINNGNTDISGKLTANIDLSEKYHEGANWTAIGNDSNKFTGTFDGDCFEITGLYNGEAVNLSSSKYRGLFGYVGEKGTVKNVEVTGSITACLWSGGVVGYNEGTIDNCGYSGTFTGSGDIGGIAGENYGTIMNCRNTSTVSGRLAVGGVAGDNRGTVENCYNTGDVTSSSYCAGGIVGNQGSGVIKNCYNTGEINVIGSGVVSLGNPITTDYSGGIVGRSTGTVSNCYSIGKVTGGNDKYVGGIAGLSNTLVTGCYYLEGTADVGVNGAASQAEAVTAAQLADKRTFVDWEFTSIWGMSTDENDMRPILRANPEHEYNDGTTPETPEEPEEPETPEEPKCECKNCDTTKCTCEGDCTGDTCACAGCSGKPDSTGGNTGGTTTPSTPSVPDDIEEPEEPEKPSHSVSDFKDVSPDSYYYDAVDWAVENGIVAGTSDTSFSPNAACSRAQIVTFLWRAKGSPRPVAASNPFKDVSPKEYYYQAVLWAHEQGVAAGISANQFSPNRSCSRGQAVTFLWRSEGSPEPASKVSPFTDVQPNSMYYKAILWAYESGIVSGTSKTTFSPNASCSRAEAVTFLYRKLAK